MSAIAYVNGQYVRQDQASVNIEDRGYQFADGVYEVIAVVSKRLVDAALHFSRLRRSLEELRIAMPVSERVLALILSRLIARNRIENGIVYLQITRGVAKRNHAFPADDVRPSLVVTTSRLKPPAPAVLERGVAVVTVPESRWTRPDIKSISLLPNVLAKQAAADQGAYEAWFVDRDGYVTEGSSTNAWIVRDGKEVVTRPIGNEILAGITRHSVIAAARRANIKVTERPFTVAEAKAAHEAFITSTTSFVLPVVSIDGERVYDGSPGPVARLLLDAYLDLVAHGEEAG